MRPTQRERGLIDIPEKHPNQTSSMHKKKRTYNTRRIKRDISYNMQEISELFGIHKNAVRNWFKAGLPKIDARRPFMVHGSDLIEFLNNRQTKRKRKCKSDELYCFRCRAPRKAKTGSIEFIPLSETKLNIHGKCEECGTSTYRAGSIKKRQEYERIFAFVTLAEKHITDRKHPPVNCHFI